MRSISGSMVRFLIICFLSVSALFCHFLSPAAAQPDTLFVFDAARETPGEQPEGWVQVIPDDQYAYTTYNIERSIDGNYLRARSAASGSWLERDIGEIDIRDWRILTWEWKVDHFPDVQWERNPGHDDFAYRIELVCDFKGTWINPLNIIRKGLITTIFRGYPPQRTISYVWSVNVPSLVPYDSLSEHHYTIIPIESTNILAGRWLRERVDILPDLAKLEPGRTLMLKKIRLRVDTDNTGSMAESGLKYLYLIKEND
ncbi:DUF3047 domain-containing protein [Candidatus Latescibacterota bacterium]